MQSTRTIYGAHLSTCKMMGSTFNVLPNSTLNQKFGVNASTTSPVIPTVNYLAIGNKGATYEPVSGNFILTQTIPHLPDHAALYGHIPFLAVKTSDENNLDPAIRNKYALKVTAPGHDGANYNFYYLMKFPNDYSGTNLEPDIEQRTVAGSTIGSASWTSSPANLDPQQVNISNIDLTTPSGEYLVSTAKVVLGLDSTTINNIINACEALFGDPRYAIINEMGVVAGSPHSGGSVGGAPFVDVVQAQIISFVYGLHSLTTSTSAITLNLDIGSAEPLLI